MRLREEEEEERAEGIIALCGAHNLHKSHVLFKFNLIYLCWGGG